MELAELILQWIDIRSFSGLWFWIMLAVVWTWTTHAPMGVPYDLVTRALGDPDAARDLEDMTRIAVTRRLDALAQGGTVTIGVSCFILTGLFLLGFIYDFELAQAFFLLIFPLFLVAALGLRLARKIKSKGLVGGDLCRAFVWHRRFIQVIGTLTLFVTALWGMYQNILHGALGG